MAAVFKVDGTDLSDHLRVNQGDGLDPYAQGQFLEPQFAEGALSDGDPLMSIREGNREQAWPVILNPAKAGYTASKDGLHALVRDVNRALKNAQTVEWKDDGATKSTFLDVQFARFEPAFDYRRSQVLWVGGVIRAWTRPYGHTGTMRLLGTAAATARPTPSGVVASGLAGDAGAELDVTVSFTSLTGSYPASGFLFAGYSVLGPGELDIWLPAASITVSNGTLTGASGAAGSQMLVLNSVGFSDLSLADLSEATHYTPGTGGVRLLALARNRGATNAFIHARDYNALATPRVPLGATQTIAPSHQWRIVDLGVIRNEREVDVRAGHANTSATGLVDCAGLLRLPENRTVAVFAPVALDPSATHVFAGGTSPARAARQQGIQPLLEMAPYVRGGHPQMPVATSGRVQGFALPDDGAQNGAVQVEVRVRERFTYAR